MEKKSTPFVVLLECSGPEFRRKFEETQVSSFQFLQKNGRASS